MKRAAYLARQNRHEEALADYTAALQVVGANKPMLLRNRAFCYGKLGRHAEALADCEASIEEDPENPQGWVRKVNALHSSQSTSAARGGRRTAATIGAMKRGARGRVTPRWATSSISYAT